MQQESQVTLDQFHTEIQWFDEHYGELMAKYPGQWVAIHHEKLVGASSDLKDLMANMKASQQPIGDTCFKFVPDKSASGLLDLYGVWEGVDIGDGDIEVSKLKIG